MGRRRKTGDVCVRGQAPRESEEGVWIEVIWAPGEKTSKGRDQCQAPLPDALRRAAHISNEH